MFPLPYAISLLCFSGWKCSNFNFSDHIKVCEKFSGFSKISLENLKTFPSIHLVDIGLLRSYSTEHSDFVCSIPNTLSVQWKKQLFVDLCCHLFRWCSPILLQYTLNHSVSCCCCALLLSASIEQVSNEFGSLVLVNDIPHHFLWKHCFCGDLSLRISIVIVLDD